MANSNSALNVFRDDLAHCVQQLPKIWQDAFNTPSAQAALTRLRVFLAEQLEAGAEIYPATPFRALHTLNPDTVKVIILGQDPYHGANQAQGLAFSVPDICPCPPSLRNIFKELALEYPDSYTPQTHELSRWAEQGVLLLNTVLTVQSGLPASHAKKGWESITDAIIANVANSPQPKVFMLWGAHAQSKQVLIPTGPGRPPSLILTSNHPSPLSAQRPPKPFIGCGHFMQANDWLARHGVSGIDWLGDDQ
ncbi:uracil-DNA glycosylase [Eoetvoesiella caeni]|uniref:Uracil-DNA glycosylase n=1 Tax=Eoetvoesiella caeni TaxID=645616 RepID=A0A366H307_9BURK|nr:uracil-DNA glycosylase [Eoetvoesiella caeni]MCI2810576.1 uracil-DNA glycosylase [Eoetvoesiella caeni]NYT56639.1 uracil-DNA glycosylase [Eoetvoesiella caeni]RBP36197.1 uracil-DNA glycosylase [Eoetvoesiella caeni]